MSATRSLALVVCLVTLVINCSANGEEAVLKRPAQKAAQFEQRLNQTEIAVAPCTKTVRHSISSYAGIILDSESVTHSSEFGYVYRYNIAPIPVRGRDSSANEIAAILVIWTNDCRSLNFMDYPIVGRPHS